MGDTGSASSAVRLHELCVDSLATKTRVVLEGIDRLLVYSIPMRLRFRNIEVREGLLLHGEYGWGECAPFWDYDPRESSTWLASALEAARVAAPRPRREKVPLNVTIPVISAEDARKRVFDHPGCATAKVKVADTRSDLERDCQRVEAVAEALVELHASSAKVRVDANGAWDRETALTWIARLNRAAQAAGGLEYVEQPCMAVEDLAWLRRKQDVPLAADESIRRAEDPLKVARLEAADVAVIKVEPLGGAGAVLQLAEELPMPLVISSALETSFGLDHAARVACALDQEPRACGLGTASLLNGDTAVSPVRVVGGNMIPTDLAVNESLITPSAPDSQLCESWVNRLNAMASHR